MRTVANGEKGDNQKKQLHPAGKIRHLNICV